MSILGSHMSISGGYYKAVICAKDCRCDCVQLFTKNNSQWRAKPISEADVVQFRETLAETGIKHPLSHSSYLINLGSPVNEMWKKSIDGFVVELNRAARLGIPHVVLHPGSFTTSSEAAGLRRIVQALDEIHGQCDGQSQCLLETTAGQGSNLGWRFEHLATILNGVKDPDRLGICFDTCHVFAAGYSMDTEKHYRTTMAKLNKTVGLKKVKAFHLNDSKRELGSRRDRHDHIGRGKMGLAPFRFLLNDARFARIPMYLETGKGQEDGVELDVINLKRLRRLIRKKA